jgi:hypothetical protein
MQLKSTFRWLARYPLAIMLSFLLGEEFDYGGDDFFKDS